ncbi:MAG: methyltransferase domain-containing protein [bacterium]
MVVKYYVTTVPGLEKISWSEISSKLNGVKLLSETEGRLLFSYDGNFKELINLRAVNDIYIFIGSIPGLTRSRNSLGEIFRRVGSFNLDPSLRIHKEAHGGKGKKSITFKVVSTMTGKHNFRRIDVQKSVELSLMRRYGWKLNLESPTLEFRMDLEDDNFLFGLRLTDERLQKKEYKLSHVPASLHPPVAYCMVLLSDPNPMDTFIDPMCGAGTIIIERALAGPYRYIIGGDKSTNSINSAKINVDASGENLHLVLWDALKMPISDHTIDKVVCNIPFGKQTGEGIDNKPFYSGFIKEIRRVIKPGGKAVLLTPEKGLMNRLVSQHSNVNLEKIYPINLFGFKAYAFVINF